MLFHASMKRMTFCPWYHLTIELQEIEYDQNNNAELLKTLECYFACKQNLRKTAEMLFVHKNSVIYRLNKIETLLGKELDNHQAAFDLQLCFKLGSIL